MSVQSAILACALLVLAAQNQPTFRASTRLVEVSVVVHDRNGRPVADLTKADFELLEDGQPQSIEIFSMQDERSAEPARGSLRPPARETVLTGDVRQADVSNWRDGQGTSVTVILIDRINSRDIDQMFVRKQVVAFLEQAGAADRVALYMLESSRIRVLHDFTTDTASLLRSLARYHARSNGDVDGARAVGPATGDPDLDAFLADSRQASQARAVRERAQITAAGLETVGQHLSGIQGRKNLIWVTSAFPLVGRDELGFVTTANAEATRIMRMLSDQNVAVYPVDDRGIPAYWVFDPAATTPLVGQATPAAPSTFAATAANGDVMQLIADATGGRAYTSNDISRAIRRALEDSRVTYTLAYYPAQPRSDQKFHRIHVNVRRAGLDVRHRAGYYAATAPPALALMTTARSPLDATGLRVSARITGEGRQRSAAIRLEPGALVLTKSGDTWEGALDILIAQSDSGGRYTKIFENRLNLRFSDEQREQVIQEGVSLTRSIALPTGSDQLHVVLRDVTTGATGSLRIPLR
jgi:VWFA-related protein